MAGAKFTSSLSSKWVGQTINRIDVAVLEIATDIEKRAKILAPVESGNLVNSGAIERVASGHYITKFGGNKVRYAKRRHFENFKNPQTLEYLARAGDSVSRSNLDKYLRNN